MVHTVEPEAVAVAPPDPILSELAKAVALGRRWVMAGSGAPAARRDLVAMDHALARLRSLISAGWVLVPGELTIPMRDASAILQWQWRAIIAARPKEPEPHD